MDEALDRGFGRKGKGGDDSDDEISREKKAASKKYYGELLISISYLF